MAPALDGRELASGTLESSLPSMLKDERKICDEILLLNQSDRVENVFRCLSFGFCISCDILWPYVFFALFSRIQLCFISAECPCILQYNKRNRDPFCYIIPTNAIFYQCILYKKVACFTVHINKMMAMDSTVQIIRTFSERLNGYPHLLLMVRQNAIRYDP